jgi:hypothetical protein
MAITLRGTKNNSGHVTGVPDTNYVLLVRDASPDQLEIIDVGGTNPTLSGSYSFSGSLDVHQAEVYGSLAYVCDNNATSSKLWIFDISDIDNGNVTLSGSTTVYDNPTKHAYVTDGQYFYMCTYNSYSDPRVIHSYNVSDPTNITWLGQSPPNNIISGPTRMKYHPVDSDYLIVMKGATGLICDISTPSAPTIPYTWSAALFTQWGYIWFDTSYDATTGSGYLYAGYQGDGGYPGGIEVYNITDPDTSTWTLVDDLQVDGEIGYEHFIIVGNYLYVECKDHPSTYYVRVVDITDPTNIAYVDSLLTGQDGDDVAFCQTAGGDAIFIVGSYTGAANTASYTVPQSSYKFAGTLTDAATISIMNTNNYVIFRQSHFSAGSYEFPAVTDQTPYHVMAERDSDGALLIYADVTPVLNE